MMQGWPLLSHWVDVSDRRYDDRRVEMHSLLLSGRCNSTISDLRELELGLLTIDADEE